jgi:hypothetical protein
LHSSSPGGIPPTIGRYKVVDRVGHGATGDVYAAVDEDMGRRVAIKVMPSGLEARATGQVTHPNVVTVFDRGEDQGRSYVVMELLEGASLGEQLPRPEARTLHAKIDLMLQICDGLQAAHDRGVVHGDLKPGNVFVQQSGVVKLLDFGNASSGSPEYVSPEQVKGAPADTRSDIYSAAGVFFFMLTGRSPLAQPMALTAGEAPEALGRALVRALDKDPDQRQQSVAHLRAEIEQVRRAQDGDRHRVARAALDRYRQIEELIDQRRALGRRLGLSAIERECDQKSAQLAAAFPEFARADTDSGLIRPMDEARASAALAQLQAWHNDVLAEVSVLQAASGGRR